LGGCGRFSPTSSSLARCSTSPPLVASVHVDDRSLSARDSTSTPSAVSLCVHEIASFGFYLMLGILHRQVLLVL
jgi:hypothetical protein